MVVLERLGVPQVVLGPLSRFHRDLRRRFRLGGHVGDAVGCAVGIPQGCPLSVLVVNAVLMGIGRVWSTVFRVCCRGCTLTMWVC